MKIIDLALGVTKIINKIIDTIENKRKKDREREINSDPQSVFKRKFVRDTEEREDEQLHTDETKSRED